MPPPPACRARGARGSQSTKTRSSSSAFPVHRPNTAMRTSSWRSRPRLGFRPTKPPSVNDEIRRADRHSAHRQQRRRKIRIHNGVEIMQQERSLIRCDPRPRLKVVFRQRQRARPRPQFADHPIRMVILRNAVTKDLSGGRVPIPIGAGASSDPVGTRDLSDHPHAASVAVRICDMGILKTSIPDQRIAY